MMPARLVGSGCRRRRELVAALVALRAEVAAVRRVPVVDVGPAVPAGELLDGQLASGDSLAARTGTAWSGCCGGSTR